MTLFSLGNVVGTPAAAELVGGRMNEFLGRHSSGDWGLVDSEDGKLNDRAVRVDDERIMSVYEVDGERFWVITEWDRSATTVLLPSEY